MESAMSESISRVDKTTEHLPSGSLRSAETYGEPQVCELVRMSSQRHRRQAGVAIVVDETLASTRAIGARRAE